MDIVEHVSYKTLGRGRRSPSVGRHIAGRSISGILLRLLARFRNDGSGLFHIELRDYLRLALVEDLKVLLVKIADSVPLGVAHYRAYHYQLHIHLEGGGFVVGGDLRGVLLAFRLRGGTWSRSLLSILRESRRWGDESPQNAEEKKGEQSTGNEDGPRRTAECDKLPHFRRTPHRNSSNRRGEGRGSRSRSSHQPGFPSKAAQQCTPVPPGARYLMWRMQLSVSPRGSSSLEPSSKAQPWHASFNGIRRL